MGCLINLQIKKEHVPGEDTEKRKARSMSGGGFDMEQRM